jgi:hypothetical protein
LFRATSVHRLSAFRAFPARPAVTPLGARCSHAVGTHHPSPGGPGSEQALPASEPFSGRASVTRAGGFSAGRAAALLASPLSEVYRSLRSDFRPSLTRFTSTTTNLTNRTSRDLSCVPGYLPSGLEAAPKSRSNLHEVSHLVRSRVGPHSTCALRCSPYEVRHVAFGSNPGRNGNRGAP